MGDPNSVNIIHSESSIENSEEIIDGVRIGGYEKAEEYPFLANRFKFFSRYVGWQPGQLDAEVRRGVWQPVACSPQLILKDCVNLPVSLYREICELTGDEDLANMAKAEMPLPSD